MGKGKGHKKLYRILNYMGNTFQVGRVSNIFLSFLLFYTIAMVKLRYIFTRE